MEIRSVATEQRPVWFVGAAFGGNDDQTNRFLRDSIWENGHADRHIEDVKSIVVGDRIAIKATYTKKHGLPFDNRGYSVSAMKIKAVGSVIDNMGDGRHLKVDWKKLDPPREWFFYTYQKTVWRVQHGSGSQPLAAAALIRFAFEGEDQDVAWFRNLPYWRDQFGDHHDIEKRFAWTRFYSEVADQLDEHRDNRGVLVSALIDLGDTVTKPFPTHDKYSDGTEGPLRDICPFTTIACFNRSTSESIREHYARELKTLLRVREAAPKFDTTSDGIPTLMPLNSWFFAYEINRDTTDIDNLWMLFSKAKGLADAGDDAVYADFVQLYNDVLSQKSVGVKNLSMALYWIRPWYYPSLDGHSQDYMTTVLNEVVPPGAKIDGEEYLRLRDRLQERFQDQNCPVHSFPELCWKAYQSEKIVENGAEGGGQAEDDESEGSDSSADGRQSLSAYTVNDILADGCFLASDKLSVALRRLEQRKNMILQGPPGTGKTWLATRLAYALVGYKDDTLVKRFQFHPNLSYEDFVRGYRPTAGELHLVDGPFLEVIEVAQNDLDNKYVVVIEEINRGNPAQIFGEMLTLLEPDKRNEDDALALAVPRSAAERVHVPPNLYVVGTMNIADRSLALVDLALRRRFTFVDLEPVFGDAWRKWMREQGGVDDNQLRKIEQRMTALNEAIASDQSLGGQFRVGHSYVTTPPGAKIGDPVSWFREVVDTEIAPLLREYWFDQTKTADDHQRRLLEDF